MKWRQMKDFRFRRWMRIGAGITVRKLVFFLIFCFYLCTYWHYCLFALRKCWLAIGSKVRQVNCGNFFLSANLKMSTNQLMKRWMKIILVKRKHIETTQLISSSGSIDHPPTGSGEHIGRFKLSAAKVTVKWRRKFSVFVN